MAVGNKMLLALSLIIFSSEGKYSVTVIANLCRSRTSCFNVSIAITMKTEFRNISSNVANIVGQIAWNSK